MNWNTEAKKYEAQFKKDLKELVAIPSLRDESTAKENAPFGEQCRKALDKMMEIGREAGFTVKDIDGYACTIEYGEGEESVGILAHLDIVPIGEDWTHDPLGCEEVDGIMYGRGTLDDKGPAVAGLTAMRMLKDNNVKLNKKIMLICGCDEESGMQCMDYYCKHAEVPTMSFTPDAEFPVIYGVGYKRDGEGRIVVNEKGIPEAGETQVIGKVSPDFRLGFNTNIELYKFRLAAVFDWKQGGQMYSGTAGETNFYGTSKLSGEVRKSDKYHFDYAAVEQKGVDADGKPIYVPYTGGVKGSDAEEYFKSVRGIDEAYVYDNSFLKLRELSLSYPVYKKDNLNVNVNVFARNIIVWSEIKGFDPEATQGNNNMAGAFERFSLPGTSSYGFGVNVNF